jgi:hypothetical protein
VLAVGISSGAALGTAVDTPDPTVFVETAGRLFRLPFDEETRQTSPTSGDEGDGLGHSELVGCKASLSLPDTGIRLKSGQKLGDAYLQANLPTVRRRLYQSSVRRALVPNEAFPAQ